jgi:TolB protein
MISYRLRTVIIMFFVLFISSCSRNSSEFQNNTRSSLNFESTNSPQPISTRTKNSPTETSTFVKTPTANAEPVLDEITPVTGIIAFYSDRDGNPEIYTIHADGSHETRLTNNPGFDDSPAISPDGKKIAFLSSRNDPAPKFPDLKYDIYIMNIDGSNLQQLTSTNVAEDHPAWSPDSKRIIFDADYDEDGFYEIYTFMSDGSSLTRLTNTKSNDQFADWSPDGKQIAYSSDRNGNWDLFLLNVITNQDDSLIADELHIQLTSNDEWELFPAWSPDGKKIAYNGLQPGSRNTDVYLMDKDGNNIQKLTDSPRFDENPTWSLDGTKIVFQTERDRNFEIYSMNVDGSDQESLSNSPADELWPSFGFRIMPQILPGFSFQKSSQLFIEPGTFQIGLGDLDGDKDLDAVLANPMSHSSEVWINNGDGSYVDSGQKLTQYGHGVVLSDLDNDTDLDAIIICHQFVTPSKIYINNGEGIFQESQFNFDDALKSGTEINLVDINGDNFPDVHISYYDPNGMPDKVFLNTGDGKFSDSNLALDEIVIAWGDLDGDGDNDYFGKTNNKEYTVQINDGRGHFTKGWQIKDPNITIGGIALADFDGDNDLDALVTNGYRKSSSFPSMLLLNDGKGSFYDSGQLINSSIGAELAIGDLDNDGDLDVFVANMDLPNEVWINDGIGNLFDSTMRLESKMSGKATLGDIDNDGDLDVIVGSFSGMPIIWINNQ